MGSIPGLAQGVKDPASLWLGCRPAAVSPVQSLAWEPPFASGAALKSKKKKKKEKRKMIKPQTPAPPALLLPHSDHCDCPLSSVNPHYTLYFLVLTIVICVHSISGFARKLKISPS